MPEPEPIDVITPVQTDLRSPARTVFLAQDGLVLSAAASAVERAGIPALIDDEKGWNAYLDALPAPARGRLRVVLRALEAAGWLGGTPRRWTPPARYDDYVAVGAYLTSFAQAVTAGRDVVWASGAGRLDELLNRVAGPDRHGEDEVTAGHLRGALLIPALLAGVTRHPGLPELAAARDLTPGIAFVGSYLPVLARLGSLVTAAGAAEGGPATLVDRALNARAVRENQHRYDEDLLTVVLDVFNRPLAGQPRFVAEVACGDGSRLRDIYLGIRNRTSRGAQLGTHPVTMVGIDADPGVLDAARELLDKHGVPALLIRGTVSDPAAIAGQLAEHGLTMADGLHVRAFADHARTLHESNRARPPHEGESESDQTREDERPGLPGADDGTWVEADGTPATDARVEADLVAHLARWTPYAKHHGLVVLEAHTVAPWVTRRFPGRLASLAHDLCHGLSGQYPVGHDRWLQCLRAAGLETVSYESRRYPADQPFVTASLNRLLPAEERSAPHVPFNPVTPEEAARPQDDGRGLHELLFAGGDTRLPRPWAADPTGWIVAQALATIERRIAHGEPGRVIRVLDYGAGTGLGAIELLKALRERRTDAQLTASGMTLELHLVDIRTPWFDMGEKLLGAHPWTRFHDLRGPDGRFRTMAEIMGAGQVDIVLASMVFHLIPPKSLTKVAADLARLITPGGTLLWNAPDVGPAGGEAFLFHDANRAIRRSVLTPPIDPDLPAAVRAAVERVHAEHSGETERRAGRRILPTPNSAPVLAGIFDEHFTGNVHQQNFEILPDELLDTLLVPSNAEEYFPELPGRADREAVIREYSARVVPRLRQTPGGTATGLTLKWTFGLHSPRDSGGAGLP